MEHMLDWDLLKVSGQWNVLWKMQIPPKVKHFLWRVTRRILPLRSNLIRRRAMVLWGLWGERNQIVWRQESKTPQLIVEGALSIWEAWKVARQGDQLSAGRTSGQ
ncbi:hypothetical protein LINPERHAP1_LOCUS39002 [Linum perenne]